jgi:uroporphyrinogen decarboxylase
MAQSGIHREVYLQLRKCLGLPEREAQVLNINTQQARLDEDVRERLLIDTYLVYSVWASVESSIVKQEGGYLVYTDEWNVKRRMPKKQGYYFDIASHPLSGDDVIERFKGYAWPDPTEPARFEGLREEAEIAGAAGKFVVLMGLCPGIVEMYSWLRGFNDFYLDLGAEPKIAEMFLDKLACLKIAYWRRALKEFGEFIDAVNEADDIAGQRGLLISPKTYRTVIKPYHRRLFEAIKESAPHVKLIFHSCGAIRTLIPDFIEIGADVLNPVQTSAAGMDPVDLKKTFGKEICFWGGGVDAQNVLSTGSEGDIRDNVRYNIEALAPGGGFVFAPTHIIQPQVPPQNIMVMWETLQRYGDYSVANI